MQSEHQLIQFFFEGSEIGRIDQESLMDSSVRNSVIASNFRENVAQNLCVESVWIAAVENRNCPVQANTKKYNLKRNLHSIKSRYINETAMDSLYSSAQVTSRNDEETCSIQNSDAVGTPNNLIENNPERARTGSLDLVNLENELQRYDCEANKCNKAEGQNYSSSEMTSDSNQNINVAYQKKFDVDSIVPSIPNDWNYILEYALILTNSLQTNKFREMDDQHKSLSKTTNQRDYFECVNSSVGIQNNEINTLSTHYLPINKDLNRTNRDLEMRNKPDGETVVDNSDRSTMYRNYEQNKQKILMTSDLHGMKNNIACIEQNASQHLMIDNSNGYVFPNFTNLINEQESIDYYNNLSETKHEDNIIEMSEYGGLKILEPSVLRNEENTEINASNIPISQMNGKCLKHGSDTKEPLKEYFETPTCDFDRLKNDTYRYLNQNCIQAVHSRTVLPKHGFSISDELRPNSSYDGILQHKSNASSSEREIELNEITFWTGNVNPLNDVPSLSDSCLSKQETETDTENLKESQLTSCVKRNSVDLKVMHTLSSRNLDSNVGILTHKEKNVHICDVCGNSFDRKDNLKRHIVIHSDVKPFKCNVCGKTFKLKMYLEHHKKIHTEERFSCQFCKKSFIRKHNLKIHSLIHSGETPHSCKICGKSFTTLRDLKRHNITHTGEKPHECEFCKKKFSQKGNLKRHFKIHIRK